MKEPSTTILESFREYLGSEGQSLNTLRGNSNTVAQFLDWLSTHSIPYVSVSYSDLLAYINYSKTKGNTKRTIKGKICAIKHFYRYLQRADLVAHNPAETVVLKGIITRQPHDLLPWESLEALYENYPTGSLTGKRNKSIIGMMIYQGLNSGEISTIEVQDLCLETAKVYVAGVGRRNSRRLKLSSAQIIPLQKYISQVRPLLLSISGKESARLFVSSGVGHGLGHSIKTVMRIAKQLNATVKHAQQIRASVLTHWLSKSSIRQVQYMAGHRYISSTDRYRTDLLETLQEQIEALHPLLS